MMTTSSKVRKRAASAPLTFCHTPPLSWQRLSSPVQSVNEEEDPGGMAGTVLLEKRLLVCERLLIVWRWICSTHIGRGLCSCGGGVVECHRRHGVHFSVDQAMLYY